MHEVEAIRASLARVAAMPAPEDVRRKYTRGVYLTYDFYRERWRECDLLPVSISQAYLMVSASLDRLAGHARCSA